MDFLPVDINEYCEKYTQKEDDVLYQLHRETHQKILRPRMLSGHLQGQILTFFSKMIQPSRILEIGTYTGYSAICLGRGLKAGGKMHTIDINEELEDFANSYFEKAGLKDQITMHVGNAMEIALKIDEQWDLVFIDADKENYINYYNLVFDQVKPGGYIISDNVLWSGRVLDPKDKSDKAIHEFNERVIQDGRVESVLLTVRDGLNCIIKN